MKIDVGFWPKPQIWPIVKNYLEMGPMYKKNLDGGWNMAWNIASCYTDTDNLAKSVKDMGQKADFEREHMVAHSCHIMKKVG